MDKLLVFNFNNNDIRTIEINDEIWWIASDICKILGYSNTTKTLEKLDDDERSNFKLGRQGNANIINESGLYTLILKSEKKEAIPFRKWITHNVLPSLRKTGSYSINQTPKELELKEKEIQLKTAEFLNNMADGILIPEYKQILNAHATKVLTGDFLLPLPAAGEVTYSATEIGKMLGISANMVGRLTKKHNLRTEEYGKVFYDKSKYSSKEVETFRYYIKVIDILKNIVSALSA
ncbi:BRO-N domain-containing protein [Sebaldella termitidis]|uniref:BRO-N domain-containing protein n=1 Tax=Sebaldella termitidis TaxID=826 RepID=UPI003EBC64D5